MTTGLSICRTCGVEHSLPLPNVCAICDDDRQYLPADGIQRWTTLEEMRDGRSMDVWEVEPGLYGITTTPSVGIGHRPLLVQTPEGNLLWDPPGYIDDNAVEKVRELGGIRWIAASHPHMFGVQMEWSAAFDNAPVFVNGHDQEWLVRTGDAIEFWDDDLTLTSNLRLLRVGGHFSGSAVAHWTGDENAGVLLSGDAIVPVPDHGWATFLRSYPNRIPLSPLAIKRISERTANLRFDRLYANFHDQICSEGASDMVARSADRYIKWITGEFDDLIW